MSYYVYPVIKTEDVCNDYEVKINGVRVDTNTARVSAYPMNRRWPGHQREKSQTELINFVSLEMDERLEFEITSASAFETVEIRPSSRGIPFTVQGNTIRFVLEKPEYLVVMPFGSQKALHIFADPVSKYQIEKEAENVIYFGPGVHDVGTIVLEHDQVLFLDAGAVVYASICATDAAHIKIMGRGILDNSRNKEKIFYEANVENNEMAVNNAERIHTIQLNYCEDIEIDGITIRDSLVYNIRPIGCRNLRIRNVKIIGCWRYNSDGIDMHNCEDVLIEDCFIRTYDDSICIKGFDGYGMDEGMEHNGVLYDRFAHVLVQNCVIWNDWGKALEIGAETRAEEIFDITFRNCDIVHVTTFALDCANVDQADVHDLTYEDIRVEYDAFMPENVIQKRDGEVFVPKAYTPILIGAEVAYHPEYSFCKERRGKNHDILFRNIILTGSQTPKICFRGYSEDAACSRITIDGIYWNGRRAKREEVILTCNEYCRDIVFR